MTKALSYYNHPAMGNASNQASKYWPLFRKSTRKHHQSHPTSRSQPVRRLKMQMSSAVLRNSSCWRILMLFLHAFLALLLTGGAALCVGLLKPANP